jgi:ubiquitin-conjugating enzyme E2 O
MAEPATATLSPAMSPSSEPPSGTHSPTAGGTQRLLFTHDLVSGKHRGAMRFGLVRMIHGEEDFEDSDSEIDCDGGGRGGGGCGGRGGGANNESGAADTRSWPLGREFVRVQWYPEGTKQDIRETQVTLTLLNGADDLCVLFFL